MTVLICGAGPVGQTLAILLLKAGIDVRLIDKRLAADTHSKALSLSPATLELFSGPVGITPAILEAAFRNPAVHIDWLSRPLHRIRFDELPTRFPFYAMLPQYTTEALLSERLEELGGALERGVKLVGLEDSDAQVRATLRDSEGESTSQAFDFVIGTDGSRSTVRDLAGIPFEGEDYGLSFVMFDAEVDWPGRAEDMVYAVGDEGFAISIPMAGGRNRIVLKADGAFEPNRTWGPADYRAMLDRVGLVDLRFGEPVWSSAAPIFNRLASSFRKGRILLAGDAAHTFSPIGGQGLNTGVQDAASLAWRLIAIERGEVSQLVLDEYATERRRYAAYVRSWTDELTHLITRKDRDPSGPLAGFLPGAVGERFRSHELPLRLSGLAGLAGTELPGSLARR